jgi:hypothetical protein
VGWTGHIRPITVQPVCPVFCVLFPQIPSWNKPKISNDFIPASHKTMSSLPEHLSQPCFAPPHPDCYRNAPRQGLLLPSGQSRTLSVPTGCVLGLNDGCIFPPSHFPETPSQSQLIRAALDRAPLRNEVRYVSRFIP